MPNQIYTPGRLRREAGGARGCRGGVLLFFEGVGGGREIVTGELGGGETDESGLAVVLTRGRDLTWGVSNEGDWLGGSWIAG